MFSVIHQVTTDHAILTRITREVIEDFAADNVQYLELRTTPKVSCLALIAMSSTSFPCMCCQQGLCLLKNFTQAPHTEGPVSLQDRPEHGMTKRSYTKAVLHGFCLAREGERVTCTGCRRVGV